MATVQTVLGPVDAAALGAVLSHEHIFSGTEWRHYPWRIDMDATMGRAVEELREAKAGGIDTIVELTTPDFGRDVSAMAEVARASGVNVVVCTGSWRDIPRYFWERDPDEIADVYVREIEVGIDRTEIRAGVIKIANDTEGIPPASERVARAAARATNRTGCPISTHHWAPTEVGRLQVKIFQEEGVQMDRVCIGHSADSTDVAYLEALLNAGVYLSMDRYPGAAGRPDWEQRNTTVKALVDRGWAHRLMLGHDYAPYPVIVGQPALRDHPTRYLFIQTTAIPALLASGVSQADIDTMMRETPRRFLTGEA